MRPASTYRFGLDPDPRERGMLQHILAQHPGDEVGETVFGEVALEWLGLKVRKPGVNYFLPQLRLQQLLILC